MGCGLALLDMVRPVGGGPNDVVGIDSHAVLDGGPGRIGPHHNRFGEPVNDWQVGPCLDAVVETGEPQGGLAAVLDCGRGGPEPGVALDQFGVDRPRSQHVWCGHGACSSIVQVAWWYSLASQSSARCR